jgi:hypothetical protein
MKLKLIHKLLIAMFACAALVLVLVTLVARAGIGRGFMDFLQEQERSQVELVVPGLAGWYAEHGSWDELAASPREFYGLVFNALLQDPEARFEFGPQRINAQSRGANNQSRGRHGPGFAGPKGGPGPLGRNGLPQRIFLLDENFEQVSGEVPPDYPRDELLAIEVDGVNAGWLGFAMIRGVELPAEEAFLTQLHKNLFIGLGLGLVVAALLAWMLADCQ